MVIFLFVDIGGIVDHHCLDLLFIMDERNIVQSLQNKCPDLGQAK
jgi:hypothetical protein